MKDFEELERGSYRDMCLKMRDVAMDLEDSPVDQYQKE